MKKMKRGIFLYMALIILPFISIAQSNDFGAELSVDYSHKLARGFGFNIEAEARFKDNFSRYNKGAISAGLHYSLFRNQLKPIGMKIKIGADYSLMSRLNKLDSYDWQHRLNAHLSISEKIGQFEISLRERYQCDWRDIAIYEYLPRMHLRTRLKLNYTPEQIPWEFFVSEEIFYRANHPRNNEFEELRTVLGATYLINTTNAITLYLKASNEINKKSPDNFYALGLTYSFR